MSGAIAGLPSGVFQGERGTARRASRRARAAGVLSTFATLAAAFVFVASSAFAQPAVRIFERDPYDRIELADDTVIEVVPLDLPNRELPKNPRANDRIKVQLLDSPAEEYFLRWKDVKEIKLFERMVLAEANALVDAGKFNEAFDYFAYLRRNYFALPGVKESLSRYLYEEAKSWQRDKQYEHAVAILNELYANDPEYDGLDRAMSAATGKLIEQRIEAADYLGARQLIRQLTSKFPNSEVAEQFRQQLLTEAESLAADAQEEFTAGRVSEANATCRRAIGIWPDSESLRDLYQKVYAAQPSIVVGVTQPVDPARTTPLIDGPMRRTGRLLSRGLVEMVGYGPEGGQYRCPEGTMEKGPLGLKISFHLQPSVSWSSGEDMLTGHDVSRYVRSMADPSSPAFREDWAGLFAGVDVRDVFDVDVLLKYGHVLPEAFLTTAVLPWNFRPDESEPRPTYGPYRLVSGDEGETRFSLIDGYFAAGPQQPAEILERYFANAHQAVEQLRDGQIAVLDRVNPWEVEEAATYDNVVVEPYAVPSVHCLLLNPQHKLLSRGAFRRALVYGIHRNAILNRQLLRNQPDGRGRVISGPFPIGYAYDNNIEPRGYNPRLAMSLAKLAAVEAAEPAPDASADPMPEAKQEQPAEALEPLVLAYPPYEIARIACNSIKRQLELVKIPIELKELPAGVPLNTFDGYDLVYAELAAWEPIVHARELLGPGGIAGRSNAYIELALRQLEAADDSRTAREQLLALHQLAHDEVCVVPLWQLTDYFAFNRHVSGLGDQPVSLYQNVEDWQSTPLLPPDTE